MWKEVISWGPNQESVKYWLIQSWKFNPDQTVGNRNDKITIINVPVYAMAVVINGLVKKLPLSFAIAPVVFGFVNVLFRTHSEGLLKTLTVRELIEGYTFSIIQTIDTLTKPLSWFGIRLPDNGMPQNKFGIFHFKNYTKGGPYEIYTGQKDPSKFAKLIKYKGKRTLGIYKDPKCNLLNGTDGITFGRFMTKDDVVYLFNGDACRSIYATYKELSHVRGIPTWRFVLPSSLFAGPNKNPANKCFCTTPKDYDKCDGILDTGPCQKGAPLAFSFPHLWQTSAKIQSGVKGMSPDPLKHESFFDVNPTLGAPVMAVGRLQVNLLMKPLPLLSGFGRIRETVLPFVWVEEKGGVEGKFETMIRAATYGLLIFEYGPLLAFGAGLAILGYTSYLLYKKRRILSAKPESTNPYTAMEKQMETKDKNLYPNLFSISSFGDQTLSKPPLYNPSQQQYKNKIDKARNGLPTQPLNPSNGSNPDQERVNWSPPGTLE